MKYLNKYHCIRFTLFNNHISPLIYNGMRYLHFFENYVRHDSDIQPKPSLIPKKPKKTEQINIDKMFDGYLRGIIEVCEDDLKELYFEDNGIDFPRNLSLSDFSQDVKNYVRNLMSDFVDAVGASVISKLDKLELGTEIYYVQIGFLEFENTKLKKGANINGFRPDINFRINDSDEIDFEHFD